MELDVSKNKITVHCKNCEIKFLKDKIEVKRTNNHFCSNKCSREYNIILQAKLSQKRKDEYYLNPKKCINCQEAIEYERKCEKKYCSTKCSAIYTQKNRGHHKWTDKGKKYLSDLAKNQIHTKHGSHLVCPNCKIQFYKHKKSKQIYCSHVCWSQYVKNNHLLRNKVGGFREKGGRGKQGWYKGYYCNSSWELAWVIYNLEHGVKFIRNKKGFPYIFNNKKFNFFPDFIIESTNEYVEIKGYLDGKNKAKIDAFPHKLNVIDKNNIKTYINYVTERYGEDFINLYELK